MEEYRQWYDEQIYDLDREINDLKSNMMDNEESYTEIMTQGDPEGFQGWIEDTLDAQRVELQQLENQRKDILKEYKQKFKRDYENYFDGGTNIKKKCKAICKNGKKCKNKVAKGRRVYCNKH